MEYWRRFDWFSDWIRSRWNTDLFSNERRADGRRGNPNHNRRPKGKLCKNYADDRQKAFSRKGGR